MNGRSPVGPFIPTDALAGLRALEENWTAIRLELDAISVRRADLPNFQDISADQRPITDDDHWKTYFFYGYGHRFTGNCARCPQTAELLDHVPGLTTAFFSILGPHKHVPEHRGPYKGVIRYHLALRIPRPWEASGIRVGSQTAHWEEGKAIAFDDTYPHEAWNGTAEDRTVLFLDIVRPLPFPHSWLNRFVIWGIARSPFVRDAKRNHDSWERKFVRPGLDDRKGCPR
ncbi:aspartyl/asparaginyl beta-hydroxylase domain-containing protein [Frankia sp. B2]|uniref:aspartyl/asparaginyl beta-hydroxylase domain-containing protein n=1 Tax=Frankia sp. B2 TaxID=2541730 RepID=UPI00141BF29D|nr:aspartyl/asparaginyl beta-hydroxylase domain-containing protein [Frankia sp. B2]